MKKLLAFAGSTSSKSINKRFVTAVANAYFQDYEVRILDLNDFEMPVFSEDKERENGHPEEAYAFSNNIRWADGILMSLAEHNAAYTAAFKNTFDWTSRLPERTVWEDKPLMVMATSDGGRGAQSVLGMAVDRFPRNGGEVICSFSLPRFSENFDPKLAIKDEQLRKELESRIEKIQIQFLMIEEGKPLKPWFLESLDDEKIPEIEDYHGKPLLILFYYLGCPGCKGRALPFANRMVVEHPDLQVIGIHTRFEGPSYTDEQIREANQEFFVRFPIYRDMEPARTFWDYRAGGTPHWILVDQNGIVKQNIFGSDPNKALLRLDLSITELLQT